MVTLPRRYVELLRDCLTGSIHLEPGVDPHVREWGQDWPLYADTMIGTKRMDNIIDCVTTAILDDVPGDLIEAGVWRGGATILMRGLLAALHVTDRTVWVADSFKGLPPPTYPQDAGDYHYTIEELRISRGQVEGNFARYGLLDSQVQFLEGWFADTLPTAPIDHLAVLRIDGDMYESTWQSLEALYPKLSPGGFVILDDYGCLENSKLAVHDYRDLNNIDTPILEVDTTGVYWRKES